MIDSHCHLDIKAFAGRLDEIIAAAVSEGVYTLINIGADLETSAKAVALAEKYDNVYATVGVHPHDAIAYDDKAEAELERMLTGRKVVAIGEIGLDYYRDLSPRPVQKKVFRRQLEMAVERRFPVVIHTREAFEDTVEIMEEYIRDLQGGVFHCFPGTASDAGRVIELGFYISVGGVITYPDSRMAKMASEVPLEHILLETDCPYLTPVPFRGKTNQPAYLRYVRDKLAQLKGIAPDEVERITDRNCRKMYRLEETFGG